MPKCALSTATVYKTPIGDLPIDLEVIEELEATGKFELMDLCVDEAEHMMEIFMRTSGSAKFRLVCCPQCEELLLELRDGSLYHCGGGCGAVLRGVDSVHLVGQDGNLLTVIGDQFDAVDVATSLRKKDIMEDEPLLFKEEEDDLKFQPQASSSVPHHVILPIKKDSVETEKLNGGMETKAKALSNHGSVNAELSSCTSEARQIKAEITDAKGKGLMDEIVEVKAVADSSVPLQLKSKRLASDSNSALRKKDIVEDEPLLLKEEENDLKLQPQDSVEKEKLNGGMEMKAKAPSNHGLVNAELSSCPSEARQIKAEITDAKGKGLMDEIVEVKEVTDCLVPLQPKSNRLASDSNSGLRKKGVVEDEPLLFKEEEDDPKLQPQVSSSVPHHVLLPIKKDSVETEKLIGGMETKAKALSNHGSVNAELSSCTTEARQIKAEITDAKGKGLMDEIVEVKEVTDCLVPLQPKSNRLASDSNSGLRKKGVVEDEPLLFKEEEDDQKLQPQDSVGTEKLNGGMEMKAKALSNHGSVNAELSSCTSEARQIKAEITDAKGKGLMDEIVEVKAVADSSVPLQPKSERLASDSNSALRKKDIVEDEPLLLKEEENDLKLQPQDSVETEKLIGGMETKAIAPSNHGSVNAELSSCTSEARQIKAEITDAKGKGLMDEIVEVKDVTDCLVPLQPKSNRLASDSNSGPRKKDIVEDEPLLFKEEEDDPKLQPQDSVETKMLNGQMEMEMETKANAHSNHGSGNAELNSCTSKTTEVALPIASLFLEGTSVILDQLGYALIVMVLGLVALSLSMIDLIHKAKKEGSTGDGWSLLPRFSRHASHNSLNCKPFGSVVEYFGLAGAVWQCIYSTIQYYYTHQKLANPIKICLLPFIFALCVAISKLVKSSPHELSAEP